jgi:sulfur-oxidizing protein SoxX
MIQTTNRLLAAAGSLAIALGTLAVAPAANAEGDNAQMIEEGKSIAFDRSKGNCLACHHIDGGQAGGTIGPPLIAMSVRFPDKEKLRAQVWDATIANPDSAMPPFGSHQIISDAELDKVVEFIWSL